MNTRSVLFSGIGLLSLLFLSSCTTDPVFQELSVTVSAFDLPAIDPSQGHYEVWFSYPEDEFGKMGAVSHGDALFVSMGTFVVDSEGTMRGVSGGTPEFRVPEGYNPNLLIDAIVTVEPPGEGNGEPGSRLVAAAFTGTSSQAVALLALNGVDAFGRKLDDVNLKGSIRLATPSSELDTDENQGVWFIDVADNPSLKLQPHPLSLDNPKWTYQAWLTRDQGGTPQYISLGTFNNAQAQDVNGPGPNAGPEVVTWQTPGEDFVNGTVLTLNDGTWGVVVSLQPTGLTFTTPFYPLMGLDSIPQGTGSSSIDVLDLRSLPEKPTVEVVVNR